MLKSCSRCGKIHDFNKTCYKNRQVRGLTDADKFRKTYKWHKKSDDIRERDKHLCRCCLANIYETTHVFNFNKLEVHHITPLEEDFSKRLDDDNLITLCCYHHKLADKDVIPRNILYKLIDSDCNFEEIRQDVGSLTIPLPFNLHFYLCFKTYLPPKSVKNAQNEKIHQLLISLEVIDMGRPAKAIDTNSQKMSKQERKAREENEKKLRGNNDKIKPFSYLTKRQKAIFKDILKNLNPDILSNLDTYLLNQTAITIERLESIEKEINSAGEYDYIDKNNKNQKGYSLDAKTIINLKSVRDMYSKDFFRCCNELSLSPQARAKISINTQPTKKKTLMDILNDEDDDNEE